MSPLTDAHLRHAHAHDKHLKAMWAGVVARLEQQEREAERLEEMRRERLDAPGERYDEETR